MGANRLVFSMSLNDRRFECQCDLWHFSSIVASMFVFQKYELLEEKWVDEL